MSILCINVNEFHARIARLVGYHTRMAAPTRERGSRRASDDPGPFCAHVFPRWRIRVSREVSQQHRQNVDRCSFRDSP